MSCHSAISRYGPSPIDLQKSSQDESSRRSTLAPLQTDEAKGHVMNKCSQSSTAPRRVHTRPGRMESNAGVETSSGVAYGAKAKQKLGSSSGGSSSISVSIFSKMQNPLAPSGPEGAYIRLERRKEARTKSTHLACPMVADPQVTPEAEEDPLPAGQIVLRVRPGPMRRARPD